MEVRLIVNEEYLRNPRQFYSTSFLHDVLASGVSTGGPSGA